MDAKAGDSVTIFFASNKRMELVGDNSAMFIDLDTEGAPIERAVVLNTEDPLSVLSSTRRLSSSDAMIGMSGEVVEAMNPLAGRCFSSGACLYSYEEMMSLYSHINADGRRLDSVSTSTMTYTEVSADAKLLAKDDRAGLSRAQSFLEALLAKQEELKNGTLRISFIMKDLCSNYASLRDTCRTYPAPSWSGMVDPSNPNDIRPFVGLSAEDNVWMFQDEVEYLLDSSSVQVKVRYAHDPFRSSRRHVVLMDLKNPSHMASYDEVTIQYDPNDPSLTIPQPQTFITNYNGSSAVTSAGANVLTSGGGVNVNTRRLSSSFESDEILDSHHRRRLAEDVFITHMRSKVFGFPRINVPGDVVKSMLSDEIPLDVANRRLNAVGSSRNISIDAELSPGGYCITELKDDFGNKLPCLSDLPDVTIQLPASYFANVMIATLPGSISWPKKADIYSIVEYTTAEIVYRSDLKHIQDLHTHESPSASPTARRALTSAQHKLSSMSFEDELQKIRVHRHLKKSELHLTKVQAQFEELDQALARMLQESNDAVEFMSHVSVKHGRRLAVVDPAVQAQMDQSAKGRESVVQYQQSQISDALIQNLKLVIPFPGGLVLGYALSTPVGNAAAGLLKVPVRQGSTCAEFHGLMGQMLGGVLELDDALLKVLTASNFVNKTLHNNLIPAWAKKLGGLIDLNKLMKPVIYGIGLIPYVGTVAKGFQNLFNTAITTTVAPIKEKLDQIQKKIEDSKIKQRNNNFLKKLQFTAKLVQKFIYASVLLSDGLVVLDAGAFWTPTNVNGVDTYNFTVVGSQCKALAVPLRQMLDEIKALKAQMLTFFGQIQQVSTLMETAVAFLASFDDAFLTSLRSIFQVLGDFLNKPISVCIPWVCWTTKQACTTIGYPCGVSYCCAWYGCWPCGIQWCSYQSCVPVPVAYSCNSCATFTVNDILNGLMSVVEALGSALMNGLNALASALNIKFPSINIPGLPSLNFLSTIDNMIANMFQTSDTVFDSFTVKVNDFMNKFDPSVVFQNIPLVLKPGQSLSPSMSPTRTPTR